MNPRKFLPHAVLAFLLLMVPLFIAAGSTGKVRGSVFDDNTGAAIADAVVYLDSACLGTRTNTEGQFVISCVPPGDYTLVVTSVGYEPSQISNVHVDSDQTTTVDIRLKPGVFDLEKVTEIKGLRIPLEFLEIGNQPDETKKQSGSNYSSGESRAKTESDASSAFIPKVAANKIMPSGGVNYSTQPPAQCPRPPHPNPNPYPEWERWSYPYDDMYFRDYGTNPFIETEDDRLSTFAIDVDNASYVLTRSYLERGELPPEEAIRVEEFVNRFDYNYAPPEEEPFAVSLEGAPSRFGRNSQLLRIGIKGREISVRERKPANLVFVIDVSGSMQREDRLGLVKKSLYYLVDELEKYDRIGIVTFNTTARVILQLTPVRNRSIIYNAINSLSAGGSTNAGEGLRLGYEMARREFDEERINRLIMCSDGVANTGMIDLDDFLRRIKGYADMGITLSTIGVGMGNYNDVLLEQLGDKGNGNYSYIDDLEEAKRVFVDNLSGTLEVIARDVKIQVDFNPAVVRSYRLLGFENRAVADRDFRNDRKDGGEIGAGHEVTALYEIKFENSRRVGQLGTIYIRYKDAETLDTEEISCPIMPSVFHAHFDNASESFRLAAAAAEFAEILKGSQWAQKSSLTAVYNTVRDVYRRESSSEVEEFMRLIERADRLSGNRAERW